MRPAPDPARTAGAAARRVGPGGSTTSPDNMAILSAPRAPARRPGPGRWPGARSGMRRCAQPRRQDAVRRHAAGRPVRCGRAPEKSPAAEAPRPFDH
ncbi:hypothetical protein A33M_2665 [Rhodovulum sp. PH10]|nr:hypothetical protein A33M_2665 [Rhodovulum sp. PH10]